MEDKKLCRISDSIGKMLVEQMSNELYNRHLYLSMATTFALEGIVDLETYYRKRAEEENTHFMWIYDYLNECDFSFSVPGVKEISEDVSDMSKVFELTVDAEIKTSNDIDAIYKKAVEEDDTHTRQWLDKLLIPEQHEEETTSRTASDIFSFTDVPVFIRAEKILKLLD